MPETVVGTVRALVAAAIPTRTIANNRAAG
jgi:hypothetical protein